MQTFLQPLQRLLANPLIVKLIEVGFGVLVIAVVFRFLGRSLPRHIKDADTRYRTRKIIGLASYVLMLLFIAGSFSDRLGQLAVAFGVIGAGIAFALQELIASFAGWVAISLGQFYKPGDRVQLGGIMGDVIDISILRTTLMECGNWVKSDLYNGRIVKIANSFVFKEPVFNYSADFPFVWDEITIPIRYGSDWALAKVILEKAVDEVMGDFVSFAKAEWMHMVQKYLIEDATIEPMVTLEANDNWLEFTVRYITNYKFRRGNKNRLFMQILSEIDKTEGKVMLASSTVELVHAPKLDVHLANFHNKI
jgi:small-conductance mechanosensitive channel